MMKRKTTVEVVSVVLALLCFGIFGCGSKESAPKKAATTISVIEKDIVGYGYINKPNVSAFKSASIGSDVVDELQKGDRVGIITLPKSEEKNPWYLVKTRKGNVGFVPGDYVDDIKLKALPHKIVGLDTKKAEEAKQIIRETENYMREYYDVELDKELTILHTDDFMGEMKRINGTYDKERDSNILGRSFNGRYLIVINMKDTEPQEYKHVLIHELAHQFQYKKARKDKLGNSHRGYLEGAAEWIALDMTKQELHVPRDYGISIKELTTSEDFDDARVKYGYGKMYSQSLFFVKEIAKTKRPRLVMSQAELL